MRQEGGRSGRAGRNMPCDGLQDGTTPGKTSRNNRSKVALHLTVISALTFDPIRIKQKINEN